MKHLRLFLEYNEYKKDIENKIDEILDKISRLGMKSLSEEELELLNAQKVGEKESEEAFKKLFNKSKEITFKSDNDRFEFDLKEIKEEIGETRYYGVMDLPDIITGDGDVIEGDVSGYIAVDIIGSVVTNFIKKGYTDFDFAEGLEYEYDDFIQEIVSKLTDNDNN